MNAAEKMRRDLISIGGHMIKQRDEIGRLKAELVETRDEFGYKKLDIMLGERRRIVGVLRVLEEEARKAGKRNRESPMGVNYHGQAVAYRIAIVAIEEAKP